MTLTPLNQVDTRVEELRKSLRSLAFEMGPDAQLPTVRELCTLFNTSRVTLDEALDMLERDTILYRKRRQGIYVSAHIYHKCICVLFDTNFFHENAVSPFLNMLWVLFAREVQRRATFKDEICTFHLVAPPSSIKAQLYTLPGEVMTMIQAERVHGFLTIGLNASDEAWIASRHIPHVAFAGHGAWLVELNSIEIGRLAIHALLQQGCRKIGIWHPNSQLISLHDDEAMMEPYVRVFREALAKNGTPFYPELIRLPPLNPSRKPEDSISYQEQGYMVAQEVFHPSHKFRPDGLFIADDMMTSGALVVLDKLGIRIGEDVTLVTHSNVGSPILFGRTAAMTVIEIDPADIVQGMFSQLDILMAGQEPPKKILKILPRLRR